MAKITNFFKEKYKDPLWQSIAILTSALWVMLLGKMVEMGGMMTLEENFAWMVAASFLLFFAVANSLLSIVSKNMVQYWGRSMLSFLLLAIGIGGLAYFFSGISIFDAGSYSWIFIVVTMAFITLMAIVRTMRSIVDFAMKEEWNNPKIKK